MGGDFIIFSQYIFYTSLHSMSTYQLCCSKFAFHDQRFHNYFWSLFSCRFANSNYRYPLYFYTRVKNTFSAKNFFNIHLL